MLKKPMEKQLTESNARAYKFSITLYGTWEECVEELESLIHPTLFAGVALDLDDFIAKDVSE